MSKAKVSVVIPVYNSEKYLSACIESVINQTYKALEIVLIDDGSNDNSLVICQAYAKLDSRVMVYHQENRGVSSARNIGIEISNGEYVTFVDSDDELVSNCIELLVSDIEHFNADISTAAKTYITKSKDKINRIEKDNEAVSVYVDTEALKLSLAYDRRMTACHGKLFRRDLIFDIRYEEGRKVNEDFYFLFLCCLKKPVLTYRNDSLYKYYYRDNSASHANFGEKYFDILFFADQKKRMIELLYPELLEQAICMEVSTHLFMLNLLCKTTDTKYHKDEVNSIEFIKRNYNNYTTTNKFEKRLSWIVAHGLYPLYKFAVRMKHYR